MSFSTTSLAGITAICPEDLQSLHVCPALCPLSPPAGQLPEAAWVSDPAHQRPQDLLGSSCTTSMYSNPPAQALPSCLPQVGKGASPC